jgi:hypothetical protein
MDAALAPALRALAAASAPLSSRLSSPVAALTRCASAATVAAAQPIGSPRDLAAALAPLGSHMEDVEEASFSAPNGDILEAHLAALAAAVKAFGCLAAGDPPGAVRDARAMAARRLAGVRAKGREHAAWADALDMFLADMAAYCAANMPRPIGSGGDRVAPRGGATRAHSGADGGVSRAHGGAGGGGGRPATRELPTTGRTAASAPSRAGSREAAREASRDAPREAPRDAPRGGGGAAAAAGAGRSAGGGERPCVADFDALIAGPLAEYVATSRALGGGLGPQTDALVRAFREERKFLAVAAVTNKPAEPDFSAIAKEMGCVGDAAAEYPPRGELASHATAVGESVAALGWVAVPSGATAFVADQAGAGQMYVDRVKMAAKKADDPDAHRAWATALEALFAGLKAYVQEHHTNCVAWNAPAVRSMSGGAPAAGMRRMTVDDDEGGAGGADAVSAFKALMDGPLAAYLAASGPLGREMGPLNDAFAAAWRKEADFVAKAVATARPAEPDFSAIGAEMGKVGEVAAEYPPRGPLANHVTAVSESVAALGWVAVGTGAAGFVGDQAGAGQMYVDRVKMGAKNAGEPDAHRAWAAALEALFAELKAYVKEYHTNCLAWNSASSSRARSTSRGRSGVGDGRGGGGGGDDSSLAAFAALVGGPVKTCVDDGVAIGGGLAVQSLAMFDAFKAEYHMLVRAAGQPRPDEDSFANLIEPIGAAMGKVADAAESVNDYLMTAMAESIPALGWVAVASGPKGFVAEYADAGAFYTAKALMQARSMSAGDKAKVQAFCRSVKDVYAQLGDFVKAHHVTGLVWNNKVKAPASVPF